MPEPTDDALVARVVIGDDEALLALYDRYAGRVFGLAQRIVHDPMATEEITQDVFLKLKARARSYVASRGSLLTWLLTIARNAALDRLRLERRRPSLADDDDPDEVWRTLADAQSDSDEYRWRSLHFAVQALPLEQRQVIELAYYQGMSHSEISEFLSWPLGTVKTRIRLGMEALRRQWLVDESPKATSTDGPAGV